MALDVEVVVVDSLSEVVVPTTGPEDPSRWTLRSSRHGERPVSILGYRIACLVLPSF